MARAHSSSSGAAATGSDGVMTTVAASPPWGKLSFPCPLCPGIFSTKLLYDIHMTTDHQHDRSKNVCMLCNKTFTRKNSLNEHLRLHTGERPHACPVCSVTFAKKSNMHAHIRTVHKSRVPARIKHVTCPTCARAFFCKRDVKNHQRLKHCY